MSPASKSRSIAEPVFEVALLDAVDVRVVQEPGGAVDPASAAAEVALEPEALGELRSRSTPPGARRLRSMQTWWARTQRAKPVLVVAGEVGRRGRADRDRRRRALSSSSVDHSRQASPHRQSSHAARASSMALHHAPSLAHLRAAIRRRTPRPASGSAPRNIHISAIRSPSNRYTKALRDSRVLPLRPSVACSHSAAHPSVADAELLVELDLAVGGFEPRADDPEQPSETRVVARHRVRATEMEHEVVGEDLRQGVVVLVEDRRRHAGSRS